MKIKIIRVLFILLLVLSNSCNSGDQEGITDKGTAVFENKAGTEENKVTELSTVHEKQETEKKEKNKIASIDKKTEFPVTKPAEPQFTSLIVDCRGLGVKPGMSPAILDEKGNNIYPGKIPIEFEKIVNEGIVSYSRKDITEARKNQRSGSQPFIITAKATHGIHADSVVIPYQEIKKLLEANQNNKFLEKYKVVFLID